MTRLSRSNARSPRDVCPYCGRHREKSHKPSSPNNTDHVRHPAAREKENRNE
jgi:hypothetical protein